jgi:molybdopterin converting factor subunit 1
MSRPNTSFGTRSSLVRLTGRPKPWQRAGVKVTVRLFASLREAAAAEEAALDLPGGARAEDAWRALCERHPALRGRRGSLSVAVNRRYAQWTDPLGEGDELVFIPPVAGG